MDFLTTARNDMLHIKTQIEGTETVSMDAITKYRRYCVALLLCECNLPSEAVSQMTVQDWLNRTDNTSGGVVVNIGNVLYHIGKSSKKILDVYYNLVRPTLLANEGKNNVTFFVGQGGVRLSNPLADVNRLKEGYDACPSVPHQDETTASSSVHEFIEQVDILDTVKEEMLYIQAQLNGKKNISKPDCTNYRRYCQMLLMHHSRLPSSAISNLNVQSWLHRVRDDEGCLQLTIADSSYKLTDFTENMLQTYFLMVRPAFMPKLRENNKACDAFFLADGGVPLKNPRGEKARFEAKYLSGETSTGPSLAHSARPWDNFLFTFPVTLDAQPPSKAQCKVAGFMEYRAFYKKWLSKQQELRQQHILAQALDRRGKKPKPSTVKQKIEGERWKSNIPKTEHVLKCWVASPEVEVEMAWLLKSVTEQSWTGLAVTQFGVEKGKGVVTVLPQRKGSVLCDYHGTTLPASEGKKRPQSGYVFFFKDCRGKSLCIDATDFPCHCHPTLDTFGRRLNHSKKKPNVVPKLQLLKCLDGERTFILFHALRDIEVGEEVLWDYGVSRSSFGGEGMDLMWLND